MSTEQRGRHAGFYVIPAGGLIGLGIGIILGYQLTGFLAGLGLGYLVFVGGPRTDQAYQDPSGSHVPINGSYLVRLVIGLYIIVSGFAIIWVPRSEWPNILAIFLVLTGVWFVVHGYKRGT
ncbi:MAG: hypothetical protein WCJ93_10035 [Methanomicrobiales archaeon]